MESEIWSIVLTIIAFVMILFLIPGNSEEYLTNGKCNHFSNATHDPVRPIPFSDKCIGIKNYLVKDERGFLEVRRGIRID